MDMSKVSFLQVTDFKKSEQDRLFDLGIPMGDVGWEPNIVVTNGKIGDNLLVAYKLFIFQNKVFPIPALIILDGKMYAIDASANAIGMDAAALVEYDEILVLISKDDVLRHIGDRNYFHHKNYATVSAVMAIETDCVQPLVEVRKQYTDEHGMKMVLNGMINRSKITAVKIWREGRKHDK